MSWSAEPASQAIAGVRKAQSETVRCGKCQMWTGGGCLLVKGSLGSYDVCDLFSGHRPWQ